MCLSRWCRALLSAVLGVAGWLGAADLPAPAWATLSGPPDAAAAVPPLAYWSETWTAPRPVVFHVLRLNLRHPAYEVAVLVAPDPDGDGPAEAALTSPVRLAEAGQVLAAVNANAFGHLPTASETERARGWFAGKAVDIAGLALTDGALRSQPDPVLASLWTDTAGRFRIGIPESLDGARQGVSSWIDRLLTAGAIVARKDGQLHPRTLVGIDAEAMVLLLIVADGRQKGYSEGISLTEAAEVMKAHGCHEATNLDGGGSSIMLAQDLAATAPTMRVLNRPSGGTPRPIPTLLAIRRRALPAP